MIEGKHAGKGLGIKGIGSRGREINPKENPGREPGTFWSAFSRFLRSNLAGSGGRRGAFPPGTTHTALENLWPSKKQDCGGAPVNVTIRGDGRMRV